MSSLPIHFDGLIFAKQSHGGISRVFRNLINALHRTGHGTPLLYLPADCPWPDGMWSVRRCDVPQAIRLRPARVLGGLSESLAKRQSYRFWSSISSGVFHSSYYSCPDGLRIPQVLSLQDTIYEDYPEVFHTDRHLRHLYDKQIAVERSHALVFSSEFARRQAQLHYDLGERPWLVSAYALDPSFLAEPRRADVDEFRQRVVNGREFVLHVGSRYLHKNVERLIHAYSGWAGRRDVALVLAGGGQMNATERDLLDSRNLLRQVVVIPQLSEGDLRLAYYAARAFVFPSLSEGFGLPLLEALSAGCPTAAARAGSLPEVGGTAPHYFDPESVDDIRAALEAVVSDSRSNSRWSVAKDEARGRTWDDVADEYSQFYRQVADAHGRY